MLRQCGGTPETTKAMPRLYLALFVATVDAVLERPPRRLQRPAAADREAALLAAGKGACPVLCVDALLPYQRLPLAFDDAVLTDVLEDVGEGGLVMTTSWDARRRRVRVFPWAGRGAAW